MTTLLQRSAPLALALALFWTPGDAAAMSCDDIMNMVQYNVPTSVVIDTMGSSGKQFSDADIKCLEERNAPAEVIAKAKEMKRPDAPAATPSRPTPAAAAPAEEEEDEQPPSSRFDEAEEIGGELDDEGEEFGASDCDELDNQAENFKAKKYVTSSYGLFQMLEANTCPTKSTNVMYYLARSLQELGMYHSAQHYYTEVVRKGPSNPLFRHALPRLAVIAALTGNDLELFKIVGKIAPESYPRKARPQLHYLMGRKSYDANELSDAAGHFDQVPEGHALYPRAQYYQGIIHYERKKMKSAFKSFREVVRAEAPYTDDREQQYLEDLKDLALLNIGRIYFGVQRFKDADKYYAKVERASTYWPQSLFERAWTNFYQGDLNLSLGLLLTVDSPYFDEVDFIPETAYLRSLIYWSYCEYDEVERLTKMFKAKYQPMRAELRGFIDSYLTDEGKKLADQAIDAYFGPDAGGSKLPVSLFARVLRNRDLSSLIRQIDLMDDEIAMIDEQKSQWRTSLGEHLVKVIESDRQRYKQRAGLSFLQEMLDHYRMVDGLLQDIDVLQFEVADAQRQDYMFKMNNPDIDELNNGPVDFATQTDIIYWPFNGEFWNDELAYYRYAEQGSCK
jgi:tetratricopeptide (TPR) repeat protein